ncbi:rhodanese-like domain-containing protein [Alsobacter sp. SYSU M60028]|uniref:Rhodanese-like domain-containing protein n=1 Tax=Alsobacter ponti TaxID=2962936 RepID=A0ABT1LA91_9HYPH|nr:rhodanese-like domain-containing protein [Alsobacter ponti]MCP8937158.1 rhodanese-like domain-containing protein [Alsobacter ponti]
MEHYSFRAVAKIAAISVLMFTGQATAQEAGILSATTGESGQKTEEVSTEQMRRIVADGSSVILDTRPRSEFVNGHIPGANNLSASPSDLAEAVGQLVSGDKAKSLILYCNGPFCQASRRVSDLLLAAGFTNVRRYQLGMPIWRSLGGPTVVEIEGVARVYKQDHTAVFLDARSTEEFAKGSLPRALHLTAEQAKSVQGSPMPLDDFNTRIVVFGRGAEQARALAAALSIRPWHNVAYYPGKFEDLEAVLRTP